MSPSNVRLMIKFITRPENLLVDVSYLSFGRLINVFYVLLSAAQTGNTGETCTSGFLPGRCPEEDVKRKWQGKFKSSFQRYFNILCILPILIIFSFNRKYFYV